MEDLILLSGGVPAVVTIISSAVQHIDATEVWQFRMLDCMSVVRRVIASLKII